MQGVDKLIQHASMLIMNSCHVQTLSYRVVGLHVYTRPALVIDWPRLFFFFRPVPKQAHCRRSTPNDQTTPLCGSSASDSDFSAAAGGVAATTATGGQAAAAAAAVAAAAVAAVAVAALAMAARTDSSIAFAATLARSSAAASVTNRSASRRDCRSASLASLRSRCRLASAAAAIEALAFTSSFSLLARSMASFASWATCTCAFELCLACRAATAS
mmetsp:Transcript_34798/g.80400  ORF Transcript_34798/g.80400 Transcript_34798/m.80400 type:complete len:216 (+) Transcript_34798:15-662(+)